MLNGSNTFKPEDMPVFRIKDIAMMGPIRNNKLPVFLDFANQITKVVVIGMDDELTDVYKKLKTGMETVNAVD